MLFWGFNEKSLKTAIFGLLQNPEAAGFWGKTYKKGKKTLKIGIFWRKAKNRFRPSRRPGQKTRFMPKPPFLVLKVLFLTKKSSFLAFFA